MAYHLISPRIGAQSIATVETSAKHPLGEIVQARDPDSKDADFIYVECSNSIAANDAVAIKHGYKIAPLTITNGKLSIEIGFAQVAFGTKNTFGWVMKNGRPVVRVANGTQADVPLFATATGGVLDDVSSSVVIQGVQAVTTVTNSAGTTTCVARYPTAHHEPPG